jgi:uncharacterized protein YunC (DUF1805 family)
MSFKHANNEKVIPKVHFENEDGRILVGNSLTSYEVGDYETDVVLGASFAGAPTGQVPLRQGCKAWIAHEAGPGKDESGIAGLPLADSFGVPAVAISTKTADLSDGQSLLLGTVSRANNAATALGVRPGISGEEAAHLLLKAPRGIKRDVTGLVDEDTYTLGKGKTGNIYACWSFSRVTEEHPKDVFVVASHGAKIMAIYALSINPKGMICNDAGFGKNNSGIEGLAILDEHGIGAATVSTDSARIGDALSTYYDGVISAVNNTAAALGVEVGQSAREAARRLLGEDISDERPDTRS